MARFAEKVFIFLVGLLVSLCVLLRNVVVILRHPRTALGKKERGEYRVMFRCLSSLISSTASPLTLVNPAYGFHEYATLRDDVKIHYVARGNHSKPLMLLLHGFPEVNSSFLSEYTLSKIFQALIILSLHYNTGIY